jgi:hypothetical protein
MGNEKYLGLPTLLVYDHLVSSRCKLKDKERAEEVLRYS